jgi:hypothetical protein
MICPDCDGSGRIRKRFLIFFTRRARCRQCLGTGQFPPPVGDVVGYRTRYRDDDDRDTLAAPSYGSSTSSSSVRDDDRFEVGSGGRSGGGGASASWGDAASPDAAPVIVDPFASESSPVGSAIAADAVDSGSSDSSSSSDASDSGTSY